ncbi:ABC transporter permease [Lysinibacillus pakistanensis]|uniref:ABC transporter permease n=1 Tax=Lysinibacillus pakistanensis TaxID=759811 RepID=A0AAX3WPZ0_9BACI|nr:ABC transporter permease [Lysinibacillus pakistanensis]MDM5234310.1 ABC transporter permease [Lysinibacillus pakistanensis]WHY44899.1 ABC transporter permease [Lysinibacillus pakistanensis]WHY49906.1 ABC transporter permease [Lysinibacillus pakistanensis]
MFTIIQAEISKLKRKKIKIGIFVFTTLLAVFVVERAIHIPRTSEIMDSFGDLYTLAFKNMSVLFLPVVLGMFGTSLFFDEYSGNTLKELLIIPITKTQIYFSKITLVFGLSFLICMYTFIITIVGANIAGGFPDFNTQTILEAFILFLEGSILIPLSMLPIIVFAVAGKSYLLPIGITLMYILPVIVVPAPLMGLHPLASSLSIYSYSSSVANDMVVRMTQISKTMITIPSYTVSIISILAITGLSIVLSLYLLKKQTL